LSRHLIWAGGFVLALAAGFGLSSLRDSRDEGTISNAAAQPIESIVAEQGPIVRTTRQGDLDLSMAIVPGQAGANDANFYMIDVDRDWKEVLSFAVRFTYLDGDRAQQFQLTQLHEGHFPLDALELPYAGRWKADVTVVRAEAGEARFSWEFVLAHP